MLVAGEKSLVVTVRGDKPRSRVSVSRCKGVRGGEMMEFGRDLDSYWGRGDAIVISVGLCILLFCAWGSSGGSSTTTGGCPAPVKLQLVLLRASITWLCTSEVDNSRGEFSPPWLSDVSAWCPSEEGGTELASLAREEGRRDDACREIGECDAEDRCGGGECSKDSFR